MNFVSGKKLPSVITAVVLAAISLSACTTINMSMPANSQNPGSTMDKDSSLSAADIMFLQMMIPHHEQAIEMSKLAATNTKNADVRDLASRIETAQQPEIELMKKLLSDAGQSEMPDHSMGDNGMMDEVDLVALAAAKDSDFDAMYLTGMIGHHNGAISMASAVSESSNSDLKTLLNNIVTSQTAEIAEMTKLLADAS